MHTRKDGRARTLARHPSPKYFMNPLLLLLLLLLTLLLKLPTAAKPPAVCV